MPSRPRVILARTSSAQTERAADLLAELDEWFAVGPSADGSPAEGFAAIEVGEHIYLPEEAAREVIARLDDIDSDWRACLKVIEPEGS